MSAVEAVRLIQDGDTVATGGFVGIGFAEEIAIALEELFVSTGEPVPGKPRNLTLVYAADKATAKSEGSIIWLIGGSSRALSAGIGGWCPNSRSWHWRMKSRPTICRRASSLTSFAISPPTGQGI